MDWELVLESLDGLDEKYHALYAKNDGDGKFHLDPALKGLVENVSSLNATVRTAQKERDGLKPYQKAIKDLGLEGAADLKGFVDALRANADKAAGAEEHVARVRKDLEETHTAALSEKDSRIGKLEKALESQIVQAASMAAISEVDGKPKLLTPILSQRLRMIEDDNGFSVRVMDDAGEPMLDGTGGFLTIRGFLEKLKTDKDYEDAFKPRQISGPGSDPKGGGRVASGSNPWAKDSWNMTLQGQIEQKNPDQARRLKAEAGYKPRFAVV